MMRYQLVGTLAVLMAVAGCSDKQETAAPPPPAAVNAAPPVPDVGRLESVKTKASGLGSTPGEAMAEAMKLALLQVNGAVIQTEGVRAKYGLDVSLNQDSASLRASAFAEQVRQRSGGVIQNLQVLELEEPGLVTPSRYKATIEAEIAKFKPSADLQKIKLVVGPVSFDQSSLPMGDKSVPAAQVSTALRQRISDALVQTGRFAVLDRDMSPEISRELDMIASGQAPSAELAKLSQAASADLVWSARVSAFAYNRRARQLRSSSRELVDYSGGWALSQKMVNVATRQVTAAQSLRGVAPERQATTLPVKIESDKILADMIDESAKAVVASILEHTFPVMVVAREGNNVILSQGGQAVAAGAHYAVVSLGKEMKDPQTGQNLGRTESPCCELVVDRVTSNLSYGRLENVQIALDDLPEGALQVRAMIRGSGAARPATQAAAPETTRPDPAAPASAPRPAAKAAAAKPAAEQGTAAKDDQW